MGQVRNVQAYILVGRDGLEDLDVDGKKILK
jgi:hypothetical protein